MFCFINTSKLWGGGESWQYETMQDFKGSYQVVSISNPEGELYPKLAEDTIRRIPFKAGRFSYLNPFMVYKAYRLFKKLAPNSVMFNTANDLKLFSFPAKWAGIKKRIYRRDNGRPISPHPLNQLLLGRGITHLSPCSNFISQAAVQKKTDIIPSQSIHMIYNSISLSKWDAIETKKISLNPSSIGLVFGCIGRVSTEKGQLFLPEIVVELKKKTSAFTVLLAGKGPTEDKLRELIKDYNVEENIRLLGFVESNKAFLEAIDCLLIPSHWEGLPTVAIEAMALNKPVIAFDVAGNPEVVVHNKTGLLVKPYNTSEFAARMADVINNVQLLQEMGESGRKLVESRFSREVTNQQLEELMT